MGREDLELQIRGQIIGYLQGSVDVSTLYGWLASLTWDAERWAPGPVVQLARSAQLFLDEFQHGDWNEEELKSLLRGLVGFVGDATTVASAGSSASTTRVVELLFPFTGARLTELRAAGRSRETASV